MSNYVATCVNRIKTLISRDLVQLEGSFEPSDYMVQAIIASSMGDNNDKD